MIEVKESTLHGRGLFARAFIPADTVLGELAVEPAADHELDGPYVLWVDGDRPVKVNCDLRFINHSDTPNAVYYDDLTVVALRDIQPGEEILHNYLGDEAAEPGDDGWGCAEEHRAEADIDETACELVPGVA